MNMSFSRNELECQNKHGILSHIRAQHEFSKDFSIVIRIIS